MYARGALDNPAVFRAHLRAVHEGVAGMPEAEQSERLEVARRHVALCRSYADSRKNLLKMRTILPKYLKGFPGVSAARSRLVRARSWDEVEALLSELAPYRVGQSGRAC
jgi:tRNA-dihydrouridine synthase B